MRGKTSARVLIDPIIPSSSVIMGKDEEDSQIRPASNGRQTRTN